jgi:hypothetical protein
MRQTYLTQYISKKDYSDFEEAVKVDELLKNGHLQ